MLSSIFETRPARAQEFFQLIRYMVLLLMGPTAIRQYRYLHKNLGQQLILTSIAIYLEATIESLINFGDTVWFYYLWRTRYNPRRYTRRLRGINVPQFIVRFWDVDPDTDTGAQVIHAREYFGMAFLAGVVAAVICIPVLLLNVYGTRTRVAEWIGRILLFFIITVGTGGNILAGSLYLMERLGHEGTIQIEPDHVRIFMTVLYTLWIIFTFVSLVCKVWVHTSSDPALKALANVFLFKVSTDTIVATNEGHNGQTDARLYANLTEDDGTGRITFGTERATQVVKLGHIRRVS